MNYTKIVKTINKDGVKGLKLLAQKKPLQELLAQKPLQELLLEKNCCGIDVATYIFQFMIDEAKKKSLIWYIVDNLSLEEIRSTVYSNGSNIVTLLCSNDTKFNTSVFEYLFANNIITSEMVAHKDEYGNNSLWYAYVNQNTIIVDLIKYGDGIVSSLTNLNNKIISGWANSFENNEVDDIYSDEFQEILETLFAEFENKFKKSNKKNVLFMI